MIYSGETGILRIYIQNVLTSRVLTFVIAQTLQIIYLSLNSAYNAHLQKQSLLASVACKHLYTYMKTERLRQTMESCRKGNDAHAKLLSDENCIFNF